ncbi:hypothetical protein HDV05_008750, partial [Chytridiales sp. JEL 0842]
MPNTDSDGDVEGAMARLKLKPSSSSSSNEQQEDQAVAESLTEHDILSRLQSIHEKLLALHSSKPSHAHLNKVLNILWKEVEQLVRQLQTLRSTPPTNDTSTDDQDQSPQPSTSDEVIEELVPLFMQFWSAQGGKELEHVYPVYLKLVKAKQTLDTYASSGVYTASHLESLSTTLMELEKGVHEFKTHHGEKG